jgi:ribokinase
MDLVVATERLPNPGETINGGDLQQFGGGKGANQAIAAARMGAEVSLIGRVGNDDFGAALRVALERDGVDTRGVRAIDAPSGVALIVVATGGSNMIIVSPGANHLLTAADVQADAAIIGTADALVLQFEAPLPAVVAAAKIAKAAGTKVLLNPSPAMAMPDGLAPLVHYLVLNETEMALMTGGSNAPADLLAMGVGAVVLTLGEAGSRYFDREQSFDVAPFVVDSVDATAAGDSYLGAFAASLGSHDIRQALRRASAAGALATTVMGAQVSLPRAADVERLIVAGA